MFRAMAVKELRETRGILLLALAAYAFLVAVEVNPLNERQYGYIPFVSDSFPGWFLWISALLAVGIGLRQTLGESIPGTYPFLLHRPADRRWLVGVKLLVGISSYAICAAAPLVVYGLWAATPGTHASPFWWSMTVPLGVCWFGMPLLYLGAFLTGIRPGRWWRSRVLPLAAASFATLVILGIAHNGGWVFWPCLAILATDVWLIAMILFVIQTHDCS